jgi:hypothetical protein
MTRSDVAGLLLLASFALWIPAAALPTRVWTAPLAERLSLIAARRRAWQAVNVSIAGATVLLVLGFAALEDPLRQHQAGVILPLSLAALLLGAPLWLASLAFRLTGITGTGSPGDVAAVSAWAGGLFLVWSWLGNAAVIGFGTTIVRSAYPATWCGWAAIALGTLILVQLLVTGDALPGAYHVGPAVIGVALLLD